MTKKHKITVNKKQLTNGLTVLAVPMHYIPKVDVQLWYGVGSKHETLREKGIAHLIEHMIFKGTDTLSESDINVITSKLSGSCNAFTAHDYTGYLFEFPTQNWQYSLQMLSDCMRNCSFKKDLLNSELKAVIQELKMYRDNYEMSAIDELMSAIFNGHPYHYPIIGYKHDLWHLDQQTLKNFYDKYYVPNNATLIVVGDVQAEEVFKQAEQYFGTIKPRTFEKQTPFYWERDLASKSVTLYRDVQQPVVIVAFVVPGAAQKNDYALDVLNWVLGSGRGSRLYKKLVDELGLATDVVAMGYDLFDYGMFFVQVQPKGVHVIASIIECIKNELNDMSINGITDAELERAKAQAHMQYIGLFENNSQLAYALGKSYLATGDAEYVLEHYTISDHELKATLDQLLKLWVRSDLMHGAYVLPLQEREKEYWRMLQEESDRLDAQLLVGRDRTSAVEPAVYANNVAINEFTGFKFPRYSSIMLDNGLEVLYYHDDRIQKVELTLEFKADYLYDPEDKQGLSNFVAQLLLKGTSKYTAAQLADLIESKGMGISSSSGFITLSMLSKDFKCGMELLTMIVSDALFAENAVEQVHHKTAIDIADYWDQPYQFAGALIRKDIYAGHPYSKSVIGTRESLDKITRVDLVENYKQFITPSGSRLALVGDFSGYDLKQVLEQTLGKWAGPRVQEINFPQLAHPNHQTITHAINRDQVVLAFAGLSIERTHPDYDKLLLFDQIFGGGVLGAMSSRLFQVREQTGLFYTIAGSALAGADKQPGLVLVKTIVSLERLHEAEKAIKDVMTSAAVSITQEELLQAKRALINSLVDHFASYRQMVSTFLALRRFDLPIDYFDKRADQLQTIQLPAVQKAAARVLVPDAMITVKIGRV